MTTTAALSSQSTIAGFPPPLSGRYISLDRFGMGGLVSAGAAVTANILYGMPIFLRAGESFSAVACTFTVVGGAGTFTRMGIYAYDQTTGFAGALIQDAGAVAADANGTTTHDHTTGMPYVVPSTGWYVLALVSSGAPTIRTFNIGSSGANYLGHVALFSTQPTPCFERAFTYGSLPNPFGGSPAFSASTHFMLGLKVS